MPKPIRERLELAEATTTADRKSGRMVIQVMTPGWGSSGYYSPEVCESAAALMPAGTQMFLDHRHQDGSGLDERGNRSLRDLAAVFTTDAYWDADAQATVVEASVTAPYREFLCDEYVAPSIGVSLNGAASDITVGEAEGKRGPIVESVAVVDSVDFVTRAGRGGKVLSVLESALPEMVCARAVDHGIAEATVNDTREALQNVLRDAYGRERQGDIAATWVWVRDFDDTTVWFEVDGPSDDSGLYAQSFTNNDGAIALTGDRTEVRVKTTYVPVARPDSTTTTATESQEDTMPKIQIEESEHTRLTETAGRVDVLESENVTLKTENAQLKEAAAAAVRADRAKVLLTESEHSFTPLEARALLADLPVKEADGTAVLDEEQFAERITEAAKESAATLTAKGGLVGFGASDDTRTTVTESKPTTNAWGRPLAEAASTSKGA